MSEDETSPRAPSGVYRYLKSPRLTAFLGIIGPLIGFIGLGLAVMVSTSWFNWFDHAISDLGHPLRLGGLHGIPGLNPAAPILNGSLIISGVITTLFAIQLFFLWREQSSLRGKTGALLLAISQINLAGVGVFHEMFILPHIITAFGLFTTLMLAPFFFGSAFLRNQTDRLFGVYTLITGIVIAGSFLGMIVLPLPWTGVAIQEIAIALASYFWILPYCIQLFFQHP